jgi:hypothetical protein
MGCTERFDLTSDREMHITNEHPFPVPVCMILDEEAIEIGDDPANVTDSDSDDEVLLDLEAPEEELSAEKTPWVPPQIDDSADEVSGVEEEPSTAVVPKKKRRNKDSPDVLFGTITFQKTDMKFGVCRIERLQQLVDMSAKHSHKCAGRLTLTNITRAIDVQVRCKCSMRCGHRLFDRNAREHGKRHDEWHGSEKREKGRDTSDLSVRVTAACITTPNIVSAHPLVPRPTHQPTSGPHTNPPHGPHTNPPLLQEPTAMNNLLRAVGLGPASSGWGAQDTSKKVEQAMTEVDREITAEIVAALKRDPSRCTDQCGMDGAGSSRAGNQAQMAAATIKMSNGPILTSVALSHTLTGHSPKLEMLSFDAGLLQLKYQHRMIVLDVCADGCKSLPTAWD